MKIKTAELTGVALDWAVWKIEHYDKPNKSADALLAALQPSYSPATDWAQGGPIIEGDRITVRHYHAFSSSIETLPERWCANLDHAVGGLTYCAEAYGPTPLIAAMRCYVASKLGDEVDIPEALT